MTPKEALDILEAGTHRPDATDAQAVSVLRTLIKQNRKALCMADEWEQAFNDGDAICPAVPSYLLRKALTKGTP